MPHRLIFAVYSVYCGRNMRFAAAGPMDVMS